MRTSLPDTGAGWRSWFPPAGGCAVIRQAASTLVHHGIRCAHLYLSQSQAELPGLLNAVTAARELRAAYQQVDAAVAPAPIPSHSSACT